MIQTTAQEPKLFIGIDIHKKSWKVHFKTDLSKWRKYNNEWYAIYIRFRRRSE